MKRRTAFGRIAAAASIPLAACSPSWPTSPSQPGASGGPAWGGTLTVAMSRDIVTLDPIRQSDAYSGAVMNSVIDTLYEVNREGKIVGRLVEKTELPQPNVYVLTIHKGVKFHDGSPLDAEAVRFNLQRHLDAESSVRHQDLQEIESMTVVDAQTLRITMRTPFAPFPARLTGGAGYILSPTAIQRLGDALPRDLRGAGSGPFQFVEWRKDVQAVVERNPGYWRKDASGKAFPYLDRIVFRPFADENVRLTNLRTGDADVLVGNPPYKDMDGLKRGNELAVNEVRSLGCSLICLNCAAEPFNQPAVRRAFSYALDRPQIRKTVFFDHGGVLDTPVPEMLGWAHLPGPYLRRDIARAKQELQSIGMSRVPFTFQISNNSPELQQTAELMKDQIKGAGLEMEIQLLDFSTVVANGASGRFHAISLGWSGDVDPDLMYPLYVGGAGFNYARYSNPRVDQALNEARQLHEQARRGELYKQAQRILFEDQPWIIYFNPPQVMVTQTSVQNLPNSYNGYFATRDYDQTWKRAPR